MVENEIEVQLNEIAWSKVDAKEERAEADFKATDDYYVLAVEMECENWAWWQANRA